MARRRVYLHPIRWTSLGLSLLEAMHLGMPVVALGTTEVPRRCRRRPASSRRGSTCSAGAARGSSPTRTRRRARGRAARAAALERYGLDRFLADWDDVLVPRRWRR